MNIGIKYYEIKTQLDSGNPTNILSVDFVINQLATEPNDYQIVIDSLQRLCKDLRENNSTQTFKDFKEELVKETALKIATELADAISVSSRIAPTPMVKISCK